MVTRTQYIRMLEQGCLVNPISPDQTIYAVLCHRLLEDGGSIPKAIERGRFGLPAASYPRYCLRLVR